MRLTDDKPLLEQVTIEQFRQNLVLLTAKKIEIPRVWILELVNVIQSQEQEIERQKERCNGYMIDYGTAIEVLTEKTEQIQQLQENISLLQRDIKHGDNYIKQLESKDPCYTCKTSMEKEELSNMVEQLQAKLEKAKEALVAARIDVLTKETDELAREVIAATEGDSTGTV